MFRHMIRWGDAAILVVALGISFAVTGSGSDRDETLAAGLMALLLSVGVARRFGVYQMRALRQPLTQAWGLGASLLLGAAVGAGLQHLMQSSPTSLRWTAVWVGTAAVMLLISRLVMIPLTRSWVANGLLRRRVAIIGATPLSGEITEWVNADQDGLNSVVGVFADDPTPPGVLVNGRISDLIALSRRQRVHTIILALPGTQAEIITTCERLRSIVADVYLAAYMPSDGRETPFRGPSKPVISLMMRPLNEMQRLQKECFDRAVGLMMLLMLSPLLLLVALLIRLEGPGPVLFRQPRIGFNNVPFTVLKFRTMHHRMTDLLADRQTSRDDPRVTRIGKYLRKFSLDELPQLINVIRGDMSLVGPRPHAPNTRAEGRLLNEVVADYAERHIIKPGLTGWAQVNGARGEIRTVQQIEQRVHYDLEYMTRWSLLLDIKIMVMTVTREIVSSRAF